MKVEATLLFQTPLNIGSGAQHGTLADRAIIKDRYGWPYLPASAFKGWLRHAVEQVARKLALSVCETHRQMCQDITHPCVVCSIFGSTWIRGKLPFADVELSGPPELKAKLEALKRQRLRPQTESRYGVSISRRRGVAQHQLLYTTELFEPGVHLEFQTTLRAFPQKPLIRQEAALLAAGLRLLPAVGRGKSGGLGWVTAQVAVYDEDRLLSDQELRETLAEGS